MFRACVLLEIEIMTTFSRFLSILQSRFFVNPAQIIFGLTRCDPLFVREIILLRICIQMKGHVFFETRVVSYRDISFFSVTQIINGIGVALLKALRETAWEGLIVVSLRWHKKRRTDTAVWLPNQTLIF